jgi:hypothetical protein
MVLVVHPKGRTQVENKVSRRIFEPKRKEGIGE